MEGSDGDLQSGDPGRCDGRRLEGAGAVADVGGGERIAAADIRQRGGPTTSS